MNMNMNILALDTSSSNLLVAVKANGQIKEFSCNTTGNHTEIIMSKIFYVCDSASINLNSVNLLVCTRGPGSFTGLRIGMSVLKGISLGLNVPIVSVPTLEFYARQICSFDGAVVTSLDARKNRYYLSVFECKDSFCKTVCPAIDGNAENLVPYLKNYTNILVTGPDKKVFSSLLKEIIPEKNITTELECTKSPSNALIELGLQLFEQEGADNPSQGPCYIRKSDAEYNLEKEMSENG